MKGVRLREESERWLDAVRQDVTAARFTSALARLDAAEREAPASFGPAAALLRARVALKRDPSDALAHLARRRASFPAPADAAEADLLAGVAYARLGDPESAEAAFGRAERALPAGAGLRIEIAYQRAAALWIRRKLRDAVRVLDAMPEAPVPLRFDVLVLRGAIDAAQGRFEHQAAVLLDALRVLHDGATEHVLPWAVIASQIASLARELPSAALRDAARNEVDRIPWTADIADFHVTALRAVAWAHALAGDDFNAFRRLKAAAAVAPTAAWQVLSLCDRAYLASCVGERRWAEQELSDARETAAAVDWTAVRGEERFALLLLAERCAPGDAALALSWVAAYRGAGHGFDRTLSSSDDRRVFALEAYSLGVVQRELGDRDEATRLLQKAYDIYAEIGFAWRAGRAALALADVTGDARWRARAAEHLAAYGRSWLVRDGAVLPSTPEERAATRLTPAQRAVFEHLVAGKRTHDIAAALGRSEFTVRNHIKAIFKTFDVNSRAELIVGVRSQG